MKGINKTNFTLFYLAVKYVPFICVFVMIIHWALRLMGFQAYFTEWICGGGFLTILIFFIGASIYNLCWIHRMQMVYAAISSCCVDFQRIVGFGKALPYVRWVLLISGIVIFVLSIVKFNHWAKKVNFEEKLMKLIL